MQRCKYFTKEYEEKYGVVSFELEKVNFAVTCIFNGVPCGTNYVKSIDEAYKLLIEYNENHEMLIFKMKSINNLKISFYYYK